MGIFFPDQRWISEGEPELGVGIVRQTLKGRVEILFPMSGQKRLYAVGNAPLRRVLFKPGDTVVDVHKRSMIVEKVQQEGNLYLYIGQGRSLSEAELGDVSVRHGVDDRLFQGDVDTPEIFALRRKTLQYDHNRRISPVSGFVGGRIDLIPHQLYIAHEVSRRYAPRVLLSDEVGLGKTIEACLILHRLLLSGRVSRVLILVPESLIHQWFVEILRRFNLWFHIFDEERCASVEEGAPEANPFLANQLIICSTAFLAGSETRAMQAFAAGWDMLVVDEAHHLEWSVEKVSPEYAVVDKLSKVTKGLLLLTATPEQLGLESHFARLRLLDPDRYPDFDIFKNESRDYKKTADIVEALLAEKKTASITSGDDSARDNLIEDLLDQHGPGRVIFRNTRSAMSGFPKRKARLTALPAAENDDPKVDWLIETMETLHPAKVLLICTSKEKVLELENALRKRASLKVGVFHEDLTIVQRDRNAAWFSEPTGARLLLCSEIGSEGRNFQFARHLVLFDLPSHPEVLEQRIGRLDRIGQSEDIEIHVPYVSGSSEEVFVRWFHEGLNAFEKNLEGGNQMMNIFGERLRDLSAAPSAPDARKQLEALIADTALFQKNLLITLTNGRDRLIEMNSFRPKIAEKLVAQIRAEDQDTSLETFLTDVFEHFGVEMEDLASRTYLLHPPQTDIEAFPSIPDEGISVTFDRKRAISREEVSFLSWDHPMVTGVMDRIQTSGTGSTSYGVLRGNGTPGILLEAIFVLETMGGQNLDVNRFLPRTPLRVVVDHAGRKVTDLYPVETFDQQLIPGQMDDLMDNEVFMETILPNMITTATQIAETLAAAEITEGLQRIHFTLDHEIARLQTLQQKNNNIRAEEIQLAVEEQANLVAFVSDARIRLDALQVIRKG
ncbi:MAG: SNF2-related protein [Bacteroidia bacterium]|nr:SNF2-related protein [Bacteroidia bacterium]